jgi:hypothetical protein
VVVVVEMRRDASFPFFGIQTNDGLRLLVDWDCLFFFGGGGTFCRTAKLHYLLEGHEELAA